MAEVIIENVRFSFVNIWDAKPNKAGVPKFSASIMIEEDNTSALKVVKKAINDAMDAAIEGGELTQARKPAVLSPLRSGSEEYMVEKKPSEYNGFYFFNAYSDNQPGIVDKRVKPILDKDEVYSGMWGNVAVSFYFTKKGGEARVAVGLNHVMKTKDDDRMDGRTNVTEAFKKYLQDANDGGDLT